MFRCLGIYRELDNSPNRQTDDARILRSVLERLEGQGVKTRVIRPDQLDAVHPSEWDLILPMCESPERLETLLELEKRSSTEWVNRPAAIGRCYRTQMVGALSWSDVPFPASEIRSVADGAGAPPSFAAPGGWWVKRGDVHNTCDRDVVRARTWSDVEMILDDFASRGIETWIVQPHIEGDLLKFYGVGSSDRGGGSTEAPGQWFTSFYHHPDQAARYTFDVERLAEHAASGARRLGLDVYGGDAIVSPDGTITLIDLNAWPSFARVREEAAGQIATHLLRTLAATQVRRHRAA